jgi:hypothetical protein
MSWEQDLISALEDEIKKDETENLYDKGFYADHGKYKPIYSFIGDIITVMFEPKSVIDWGCGTGFLLERLAEQGVQKLRGIEGSEDASKFWNDTIKDVIKIQNVVQYKAKEKYDVAVCMEVAEHIPANDSSKLVKNVTNSTSNFVWWTAAPPGQGGTGHINCRDICYWVREFESCGFVAQWEMTYEAKTQMLKIADITQAYPWFRDNVTIFKKVRR